MFLDEDMNTKDGSKMEFDANQLIQMASKYLGEEGMDKNLIEMATQYLGKEGVEQILMGDFSKLEEVGQSILGGRNGGDLINNFLNAIPEGTLGRKLEDMRKVKTDENK